MKQETEHLGKTHILLIVTPPVIIIHKKFPITWKRAQ